MPPVCEVMNHPVETGIGGGFVGFAAEIAVGRLVVAGGTGAATGGGPAAARPVEPGAATLVRGTRGLQGAAMPSGSRVATPGPNSQGAEAVRREKAAYYHHRHPAPSLPYSVTAAGGTERCPWAPVCILSSHSCAHWMQCCYCLRNPPGRPRWGRSGSVSRWRCWGWGGGRGEGAGAARCIDTIVKSSPMLRSLLEVERLVAARCIVATKNCYCRHKLLVVILQA